MRHPTARSISVIASATSRADDRIFRAIVYNKGAMVLHMLRRLVGDDEFFAGIRAFYQEWKFKKAGTDDFRKVMEKVSGRDLQRFFDTWVLWIRRFRTSSSATTSPGPRPTIRFEQHAEPVDVPVTVTRDIQLRRHRKHPGGPRRQAHRTHDSAEGPGAHDRGQCRQRRAGRDRPLRVGDVVRIRIRFAASGCRITDQPDSDTDQNSVPNRKKCMIGGYGNRHADD